MIGGGKGEGQPVVDVVALRGRTLAEEVVSVGS